MDPDREPVDEGETEGHAVPRLSRAGAAIRRVAIDVSPLRESRAFRLLTFGQLISLTGRQVSTVALPIQIYVLTQSSLALGLVGLVQIVPLAVFSMWGGTWADRFDRRMLIIASECGLAVTSVLLLLGAVQGHPPVWYLYAVVALQTAFFGVNFPTRSAVLPSVVGRERLPAALALNQVMYNTTLVVGPAAAGFIIGAASSTTTGLVIAYGLDVATFVASIGTAIALPPLLPERIEGTRQATGWQSVKEGFRFLRGKRVLISTFVIDLNAMIFGMPRALFPVLAAEVFHRGPAAVGLLYAAPALGAVVGALTTGWVGRVETPGDGRHLVRGRLGGHHHAVRPLGELLLDGAAPAGGGRRGRHGERRLPGDHPPVERPRRAARPAVGGPHPGGDGRSAPGRLRIGRRWPRSPRRSSPRPAARPSSR